MFKSVSRVFQGCSKNMSIMFLRSFDGISRVFMSLLKYKVLLISRRKSLQKLSSFCNFCLIIQFSKEIEKFSQPKLP